MILPRPSYDPLTMDCTVNPNPVQLTAFPCESIPTGKNLLSLQGNPVLIAGSLFSLQGFPCISLYFPVRDCSAVLCNDSLELLTIPQCAAACHLPTTPQTLLLVDPFDLIWLKTVGLISVMTISHCVAACQLPTAPCHAYCYTWIANHYFSCWRLILQDQLIR